MENKDVISVSKAVELAGSKIRELPKFTVIGEVTNFKGRNARSGHCYFEVKDDQSSMQVSIWRSNYDKCNVELRNGMEVHLTGSFNVYSARGSLSFIADKITVAGEGLLRQQVAELQRQLAQEGLLDDSRKRDIPKFCERVAVVTSMSGDAVVDVKNTLNRRNKFVSLQLFGSKVQGDGAPKDIIRALKHAATYKPDCILLVRGGGSYEDLMTFNDEELCRYIASCPVPVVTGIGHAQDVTTADLVADRCTNTPTAAAESVAPTLDEITKFNNDRADKMHKIISEKIKSNLKDLDRLSRNMQLAQTHLVKEKIRQIEALENRKCLTDPTGFLDIKAIDLCETTERFYAAWDRYFEKRQNEVSRYQDGMKLVKNHLFNKPKTFIDIMAGKLDSLSPLKVLSRGYSLTRDSQGHVVESVNNVHVGDSVDIRLSDGDITCTVDKINTIN